MNWTAGNASGGYGDRCRRGLRWAEAGHEAIEAQLSQQEDTQISLTDPDARSMQGTGKATGTVGYNVQCAVEIKNHLIVAHEVTNAVNGRNQLLSMAKQAKAALGAETMEAFADRGYYNSDEVLACEGTGILPYVPKTQTSNNPNRGLFNGEDFIYDAKNDHYTRKWGANSNARKPFAT